MLHPCWCFVHKTLRHLRCALCRFVVHYCNYVYVHQMLAWPLQLFLWIVFQEWWENSDIRRIFNGIVLVERKEPSMLRFLLQKDVAALIRWANVEIVTYCTYFYPNFFIKLENIDH